MGSSLRASEFELRNRSTISKGAEANPAPFLFSGLCPNSERKRVRDCEQRFVLRPARLLEFQIDQNDLLGQTTESAFHPRKQALIGDVTTELA